MTDEETDFIEIPDTCDEIVEYDNRIFQSIDMAAPDVEENKDSRHKWDEIEEKFARYERNYRARRIRDLTTPPPLKKVGRVRQKRLAA